MSDQQSIRNEEIRDEAWKDFAHREQYGYTDVQSALAFDGGWDAALASPVIRSIQAEVLRSAVTSGLFGTGAQSTLLARADRLENGELK